MVKTRQEKLLEEYKDYLHFKADNYSKKGFEYNDVFNQGYLYLLENYPSYGHVPSFMRKKVDSDLRTYYNHEIKERRIAYGINPENIYR